TRLRYASVGVQLLFGKQQMVAHSQLSPSLTGKKSAKVFRMDNDILRRALRLAVKEIRHGGHSVELVWLAGVELQFHGLFQHPAAVRLNCVIHSIGRQVQLARPGYGPTVQTDIGKERWIAQLAEDPCVLARHQAG